MTSLGSVLHEDGPLGVKVVEWFFTILSLVLFGCCFLLFRWGEAEPTPGWRGNFHSIKKESLQFGLAGEYVLVDVFVSRQIRQVLHFVRKMPIRTSVVFQAAGLQAFPNAWVFLARDCCGVPIDVS